ncbi:MAG: hypothetical protein JWO22_3917 [Frankiales bacterium]|nr:hypothetical protein [Frankiales bacterium]
MRRREVSPGAGSRQGALWNIAGQLSLQLGYVVTTPWLLHGLGLEAFGVWALLGTVVTVLSAFDLGAVPSVARFVAMEPAERRADYTGRLLGTLVWLIGTLVLLLLGLRVLVGHAVLGWVGVSGSLQPTAALVMTAAAPLVGIVLLSGAVSGVLVAAQDFRGTSVAALAQTVAFVALIWAWRAPSLTVREVVLASIASSLVRLTLLGARVAPLASLPRRALLTKAELGAFFHYASRMQVNAISALIALEADALIVAAALPLRSLALYSVGAQVAVAVRNAPLWVLETVAARLTAVTSVRGAAAVTAMQALAATWQRLVLRWAAVVLPAVFLGVLAWLGRGFAETATVALVLAVGSMVNLLSGVLTSWTRTLGRPELETRYGVLSMVVNVSLTLALVWPLQVYGVVAATSAAQVVGTVYFLRVSRQLPGGGFRAALPGDRPGLLLGLAAGSAGICVVPVVVGWHGLSALVFCAAGAGSLFLLAVRRPWDALHLVSADHRDTEGS